MRPLFADTASDMIDLVAPAANARSRCSNSSPFRRGSRSRRGCRTRASSACDDRPNGGVNRSPVWVIDGNLGGWRWTSRRDVTGWPRKRRRSKHQPSVSVGPTTPPRRALTSSPTSSWPHCVLPGWRPRRPNIPAAFVGRPQRPWVLGRRRHRGCVGPRRVMRSAAPQSIRRRRKQSPRCRVAKPYLSQSVAPRRRLLDTIWVPCGSIRVRNPPS